MLDLTFDQVLRVVRSLPGEQKSVLLHMLQIEETSQSPTRSELIAEWKALRASGAFDRAESLRDAYPAPHLNAIDDEELRAAIQESSTTWKRDLAELVAYDN